MKRNVRCVLALSMSLVCLVAAAGADQRTVDFEELTFPLGKSEYNGADLAGGFTSQATHFDNTYTDFGGFAAWSGWSYSKHTNITNPDYTNQYSAFNKPSGGGSSSSQYGVAFGSPYDALRIDLPAGYHPLSMEVTNTTYAALSMLSGDSFAKKFGGPTGQEADWFRLTIFGLDAQDTTLGSVEFYLADYRAALAANDYVVDHWTAIDLSSLSGARALTFLLESTDNDPTYGMNTPAYFALDNLVLATAPEPGSFPLAALAAAAGLLYSRLPQSRGRKTNVRQRRART